MAAALCVILVFGIELGESVASGQSTTPFFIALPLALAPVPLLVAAVLFIDRLEPEPRINLAFGFLWGAGVAALFAALINTAGLEYITQPALGASAGQYISATAGAPVVEETLKGLFLVWLVRWRRQELDGPTDGIVYAAMVGLGFAMTENIGYYINALVNPVHGGVQLLGYTFVLRGVLSPFLHPIFTSMTGIGAAYAASHRNAGWGAVAGLVRRRVPARHVERAQHFRAGRDRRRVPDPARPARHPVGRHHRGPPPDHRPDRALPARLRAHRPGHAAGHHDAQLAEGPAARPQLGAGDRRPARGVGDG